MKKLILIFWLLYTLGISAQCWQYLKASYATNFTIKTDGKLFSWGRNLEGELGDGTTVNRNLPTQIGNSINWKFISNCSTHTLGIKTDGTILFIRKKFLNF